MLILSRPNTVQTIRSQSIQDEIIGIIDQSVDCLKIAVTWFTNQSIFDAVLKKLLIPGYTVELIVLNDRINNKGRGLNFQQFINKRGRFYYSNTESMVHHKFCLVDKKIVLTGSYNWTYYAENRNWENVLIIKDSDIVAAYLSEFDEIINNHVRIFSIALNKKVDDNLGAIDYLKIDYQIQAELEQKKGNNLIAAEIYTESLRLDSNQQSIANERETILGKYNNTQTIQITPFEIGILYQNGYSMVIPAFTPLPLPFPATAAGVTVNDDQKNIHITIQKRDIETKTILEFDLLNIQPSSKGTEKTHYTFSIGNDGICNIIVAEVGGFGRSASRSINLKNCR